MGPIAERVEADFAPVSGHLMAVMLWSSHARGQAHDGSDVDVCIVAGPGRAPEETLREACAARTWVARATTSKCSRSSRSS